MTKKPTNNATPIKRDLANTAIKEFYQLVQETLSIAQFLMVKSELSWTEYAWLVAVLSLVERQTEELIRLQSSLVTLASANGPKMPMNGLKQPAFYQMNYLDDDDDDDLPF